MDDRKLAEAMSLGRNESLYPTCDDWAPSFDAPPDGAGGFVGVHIFQRIGVPYEYAVSVYNAKTSSMHSKPMSLDDAREVVRRLPSIVTVDHLLSIGFRWT